MNYNDDYHTPPLDRAFAAFCRRLCLIVITLTAIIVLALYAARPTTRTTQTHPTMTVENRK